jgi:hypothetical protein
MISKNAEASIRSALIKAAAVGGAEVLSLAMRRSKVAVASAR